jgi:antitoxin HigA-1
MTAKSRSTTKQTTKKKNKKRQDLLPLVTPGEMLLEEFMKPLNLSANALGLALRVPSNRILGIIHGTRAISADTALRLSRYFGNSAEFWMNLETLFQLELAKRELKEQITRDVLPGPHLAKR